MFHASRYQSASFFFLSASVTTTQRHPCWLPPVGACSARLRHSSITSGGTGLSRSRRLRTARVVVSSSSTVFSSTYLPQCSSNAGNNVVPVDLFEVRRVQSDEVVADGRRCKVTICECGEELVLVGKRIGMAGMAIAGVPSIAETPGQHRPVCRTVDLENTEGRPRPHRVYAALRN